MSTPTLEQRPGMAWNARDQVSSAQGYLESCILVTPTGPERNELCDANIHLLEAMIILKKFVE